MTSDVPAPDVMVKEASSGMVSLMDTTSDVLVPRAITVNVTCSPAVTLIASGSSSVGGSVSVNIQIKLII